jgi:hypothetical protein
LDNKQKDNRRNFQQQKDTGQPHNRDPNEMKKDGQGRNVVNKQPQNIREGEHSDLDERERKSA